MLLIIYHKPIAQKKKKMSLSNSFTVFVLSLVVCLVIPKCQADANATQTSKLVIDANSGRPISDTFFGVFYEVN